MVLLGVLHLSFPLVGGVALALGISPLWSEADAEAEAAMCAGLALMGVSVPGGRSLASGLAATPFFFFLSITLYGPAHRTPLLFPFRPPDCSCVGVPPWDPVFVGQFLLPDPDAVPGYSMRLTPIGPGRYATGVEFVAHLEQGVRLSAGG